MGARVGKFWTKIPILWGDFPVNHAILRNVVSNFETFSHLPCPNVFGESFYSKDIPKNNFVEKNPSHQEAQPPQGRGTEGRWEDRTLGRWTTGARGRLDFWFVPSMTSKQGNQKKKIKGKNVCEKLAPHLYCSSIVQTLWWKVPNREVRWKCVLESFFVVVQRTGNLSSNIWVFQMKALGVVILEQTAVKN